MLIPILSFFVLLQTVQIFLDCFLITWLTQIYLTKSEIIKKSYSSQEVISNRSTNTEPNINSKSVFAVIKQKQSFKDVY